MVPFNVRRGRRPNIDGHKSMTDDIVELMRNSQALEVEAMLRCRGPLSLRSLELRALQSVSRAQRISRDERAQYERCVADDIRNRASSGSDDDRRRDNRCHESTHEQRARSVSVLSHRKGQQHDDANGNLIRMERHQTDQKERNDSRQNAHW
jgi:hypothetical protein